MRKPGRRKEDIGDQGGKRRARRGKEKTAGEGR